MAPKKSNTCSWAAFWAPLVVFPIAGYIGMTTSPVYGTPGDMAAGSAIRGFMVGLWLAGSSAMILGIAAIIRKERAAIAGGGAATVGGLIFLFFTAVSVLAQLRAPERERQTKANIEADKTRWQSIEEAAGAYKNAFIAEPALAGSAEYWNQEDLSRPMAELGLKWALQEEGFQLPAAARKYVLDELPDVRGLLFGRGHYTYEELMALYEDSRNSHEVRSLALDSLLRDERTQLSLTQLGQVVRDFPRLWSLALARISDEQLSAVIGSVEYPESFRKQAEDARRIRAQVKAILHQK